MLACFHQTEDSQPTTRVQLSDKRMLTIDAGVDCLVSARLSGPVVDRAGLRMPPCNDAALWMTCIPQAEGLIAVKHVLHGSSSGQCCPAILHL